RRGVAVGLDPEYSVGTGPASVRAVERSVLTEERAAAGPREDLCGIALVEPFGPHRLERGTAESEDLPAEPERLVAAVLFAPADDVAIAIAGARIHCVDRLRRAAALRVVRQSEIDVARALVDGHPLGAIHLRGA